MTEPLCIELSWPVPQLGSNASVHHMVRHRYRKAARTEANWQTRYALGQNRDWAPAAETIKVHLICSPPKGTVQPDADGMVYRVKGSLDGIADALNVNDRIFEAPTIEWADRCERGKLTVELS
jgi:hypothetical protein